MRVAWRLGILACVLVLGLSAQSSNKPDFSGTWKLDVLRSRFGKVPQPAGMSMQIEHREPQIRLLTITTTNTGESRETLDLTTDGKQYPRIAQGPTCVVTAGWDRWSGTRLVVETNCPGNMLSRRLTLGAKGRILTTVVTLKDRSGEKKAYEFFFRQ